MTKVNSFIETGVLVGYSVLLDPHFSNCQSYLSSNNKDFYTSQDVRTEYNNVKNKVRKRLSSGVFDHIRDLKQSSKTGYLDPMDVDDIKKRVLDSRNPAFQFLYAYYDRTLNRGIQMSDLTLRLRNIARELDRIILAREARLNGFLNIWTPQQKHPSVESALSAIHYPDRTFAIHAHDLADAVSGHTELATANPVDFVYNGRKKLILSNTSLDDVIDLSV